MAVSQSDTQWNPAVKNAAGKVVKKGYLSQRGKPQKRVTAAVKMVVDTQGRKAGEKQKYSSGRRVAAKPAKPVSRGGSAPSSSGPSTSTTRPATFTSTGSNKPNTYQTGRGQEAMQKAASARQNAAARERRGMTSGTVTSAKKQTGRNPRVWDSMNPVQKTLTVLGAPLVGPIANANRSASGQKDEYGKAYKPKPESVKRGITYYANGNARVWDPKLKKMITVSPNDRRHPKGKK